MSRRLNNTGVPPRSTVTWTVPATGVAVSGGSPTAVRFRWPDDGPPPRDELDAAWARLGLVGAILMLPVTSQDAFADVATATDPVLAANVLGRTRGLLLTATAPLSNHGPGEYMLLTDDPRLVALVTEAPR